MHRLLLPLFFAILLVTVGCGEFIDPFDRSDGRHLAQGFTPCGDFLAPPGEKVICNPNQYCADATFSKCFTGCLSEYNCTENQRCVKEVGEDVGYCKQLD